MRLLQTSKGRSCGCYGSMYSELLKLGAYLYFKTNRYHISNSRCCKEDRVYCRVFYVGSEATGVSCGGSQVGSCSLTRQGSLLYYG